MQQQRHHRGQHPQRQDLLAGRAPPSAPRLRFGAYVAQYRGWLPEKAVADYWSRIRDHEKYYEPVEETVWPFIRIFDVRRRDMPSHALTSLQVGDKIIVNVRWAHRQPRLLLIGLTSGSKVTCRFARQLCLRRAVDALFRHG